MRIKLLIGTALAVAGLLAGCGGGGSKSSSQTGALRTLVGYVYVKAASNTNASDADVIITPASTPPAEPHKYDVPTAGKVTLIAENGTFLQKVSGNVATSTFTKDLSLGNDIILNAQLETGGQVTVAGSGITSGASVKYLDQFSTTLNDGNAAGTTCLLRSPGDPETRTPDKSAIAEIKFTLDGVAPTDPNDIVAGDRKYIGLGYIDTNGLAVPGVPSIGKGVTLTSSLPAKVQVNSESNILTTAVKGQSAGDVTIHVAITAPSAASADLNLTYGFGEPANVVIYRKTKSGLSRVDLANLDPVVMRWNIETDPRASNSPSSVTLVAEVTNKYGATMPGLTIDWTCPKVQNNVWKTSSGGYAFVDPNDDIISMPSTVTDENGQATVIYKAPTPVDGPLGGKPGDAYGNLGGDDQVVKAMNFVFATVNGTTAKNTSPAKFYLTRQFNNVVIAESTVSKYLDINAYTRVPYTAYATDIDGWECKEGFVVTWKATNVQGGHKVGNPGEEDLIAHIAPTAQAYFEGATLVTGQVSGQAIIQAKTDDLVPVVSDPYQVNIWGPPSQIYMGDGPASPDINKRWEFSKTPTAVIPFGYPVSELTRSHFEPNGDTPPLLVCYMYLYTCDSWGYDTINDEQAYRLIAIPATVPDGYTFSATYISPLGYGSISTPTTPLGPAGGRPLIAIWGPYSGSNGEITITWGGTWAGSTPNCPTPTTGVPFLITRKIRVNNGG